MTYSPNPNLFKSERGIVSKKDFLVAERDKLIIHRERMWREILDLRHSETFVTVSKIKDWDEYFRKRRALLEQELQELRTETGIQINNLN